MDKFHDITTHSSGSSVSFFFFSNWSLLIDLKINHNNFNDLLHNRRKLDKPQIQQLNTLVLRLWYICLNLILISCLKWKTIRLVLTPVAVWGHHPGKRSLPGSRWNTSRRSGTCQQEAQILVNYTVPQSTVNHRQRMGRHMGQGRVPQSEQAGSGSAGQQEVVIATASHDCEGWGWERWVLKVHGWSRQKQANVDITTIGREDRQAIWTR